MAHDESVANLPNRNNPFSVVHMLGPNRFKAWIKLKGKTVHLGYFSTPEAANEAFEAAKAADEEAA